MFVISKVTTTYMEQPVLSAYVLKEGGRVRIAKFVVCLTDSQFFSANGLWDAAQSDLTNCGECFVGVLTLLSLGEPE